MNNLRLSEAIRLGAMLKPQHHDSRKFFIESGGYTSNGPLGLTVGGFECSCVMGAAIEGADLQDDDAIDGSTGWPKTWGLKREMECPQCDDYEVENLYEVLTHLNDDHHWKRERIADFVESIENAQPAEVEKGESCVTQL